MASWRAVVSRRESRTVRLSEEEMRFVSKASHLTNAASVSAHMRHLILTGSMRILEAGNQPQSPPTPADPIPLDWLILTSALVGELARAQLGDERVDAVKSDALRRAQERKQRQQGAA